MSKYQVIIQKADGGVIVSPAYDGWHVAAVTADELARIVDRDCVVSFVAGGGEIVAGGTEYAMYIDACERLEYEQVTA